MREHRTAAGLKGRKAMDKNIEALMQKNARHTARGAVASYIPELAKQDPSLLGLCLMDIDGHARCFGDYDSRFTVQSIIKVPVLLAALLDNSMEKLFQKINISPTADGFNSIVSLETKSDKKPLNPFINSGAIAALSMVAGDTPAQKLERVLSLFRRIAGNDGLSVCQAVYRSENETGHRNRALAYYMKSTGILECDVEPLLDAYFRLCAVEADCRDIAALGCFLARNGVTIDGERLARRETCRIIKAVMATCGMYDGSGDFAAMVGIPAKSGVGGGILGVVPGLCGIGVLGPALDEHGNSLAGVMLLHDLSEAFNWSIY